MRSSTVLFASWRRRCKVLAMVLLCVTAGMAHAQDAASDDNADPPSRVARLSYIAGDLGFLPAGATDWSDASVNRPLTTGDRLSTGQGSRAELELGGGTLRMAGRTEFGVLELSDQIAQFELTEGTLNITVRDLDEGQSYEIDTPTVALVIDQPSTFRVDINDDGGGSSTRVTAFDGRATVYGENNAQRTVLAGRSYRFVDSSLAAVAIDDIGGGDEFDAWSSERDSSYAQSNSNQYVGDDVIGSQDLDQYGDWQDTDDYGAVWFPTDTPADWAPYSDGHWAYILPWGWTWVDNLAWGFAPYHYGRWAYVRHRWGWIPGPRGVRPVYAPALVAFVGGGGWSAGIGGGPVGWFPLGPGEIYNPWYRCGRRCYTNVNVNNIRGRQGEDRTRFIEHIHDRYNHYKGGTPVPGEHYANRDAPRGFTAVPGQVFASGRNLRHDVLHVDPRQLASAPVLTRGAGVRPAPGAIAGSRSPHARALPPGGFERDVVARHTPTETLANHRSGSSPRNSQASTAPANVHVLDPRTAAGHGSYSPDDKQAGRGLSTAGNFTHPLPATPNPGAAEPTATRETVERREGLPSSRFAHSQPRNMPDHGINSRSTTLGPGEGYISGSGNGQPRESYRGPSTLPQTPHIQRAAQIDQVTSDASREPRIGNGPAMRNDSPTRENMPARRFDRSNDVMRMPDRPAYQPARAEPMRQNYQPRYEAPQRAAQEFRPQPHMESHEQRSAPSHGESHSGGHAASGGRDDSHGH
ncbi:MAG TPA: DUF6600 domain-containing protein [Rhodanobacter sp.]